MSRYAWGIDVGDGTLKAIRLKAKSKSLCVVQAIEIPYLDPFLEKKSAPSCLDRRAIAALYQLGSTTRIHYQDKVAVGFSSFHAFEGIIDLPRIEKDKRDEMIRYELSSHIILPLADLKITHCHHRLRSTDMEIALVHAAKKQEFKRQEDKLAKLEDQIKKARIVAPTDGMVVYATSAQRGSWRRESRTPLDEGVEVFERQELIYLPTASSAMAEVDIHEASLKKVRVGLPAVITVDALPGKRFVGTVGRIAPLPDAQSMWMNPDLKVYNSDIYLEGEDPALRTGMSCKVEIVADQYDDVVYIPIQAVIRIAGKPTVFVAMDGNRNGPFEECEVEIGLDNNRMVHITSGLSEGEIVMLTPPLKSATIDSGSRLTDDDSTAVTDGLKATISEKLEQVNGVEQVDPGVPGDPAKAEPGGEQRGRPSKEQMEEMRRRFENMSPEEKKKAMEKFRGGGQDPEGRSGRGGRRRPDDSGKDG